MEFRAHLVRFPPGSVDRTNRRHWYFTEGGPSEKSAAATDVSSAPAPIRFLDRPFPAIDASKIHTAMSKSFSHLVATASRALSADSGGGAGATGAEASAKGKGESEEGSESNPTKKDEKPAGSGQRWQLNNLPSVSKLTQMFRDRTTSDNTE